jgi:hypothetical protein
MTLIITALGLGALFGAALIGNSLWEVSRAEARVPPIPVESNFHPTVMRRGR